MSEGELTRRILVGVFPMEGGQTIAFEDVSGPLVASAAAKLDEARRKREREETRTKAAVMQAARSRGRLRRALHAVFRRGGHGP